MYLIKIEAFCTKTEDFYQTYLNTGSKTQNVEEFSLDLIFNNNFGLISGKVAKVLVNKSPS